MHRDTTLTEENFGSLLAWLDADVRAAAEKYERVRRRLIWVFAGRGCQEADALADLTIDRVTLKLEELNGKYDGDPALYFYGVANHIYHEWLRDQQKELEMMKSDPPDKLTSGQFARFMLLEDGLDKLAPDDREFITEYYRGDGGKKIHLRRRQADRMGLTINALRKKAARVRGQLFRFMAVKRT